MAADGRLLRRVLGGAVTVAAYALAPRLLAKPPFGAKSGTHPSSFDRLTLIGSAIFG